MKIRIKRKGNKIWVHSSICIVLGVGVIGGICYKRRRQKSVDLMKEVALSLFNNTINERMSPIKNGQLEWQIEIKKIQVISGNIEEFIVKIDYDLNLIDDLECEYQTEHWMMRIKRAEDKRYEVVEQGEEL